MAFSMDVLPVELISEILEHLTPRELANLQLVSKKFLFYSRENNLWRLHCYEGTRRRRQGRSWSGSVLKSRDGGDPSIDTPGLSIDGGGEEKSLPRRRARATDWDPSFPKEEIDWYSEYVARHAPISVTWFEQPYTQTGEDDRGGTRLDTKGMGFMRDWGSTAEDKVIGPLEDGSICIWDLNQSCSGSLETRRRKGKITGMSAPGALLTDLSRRSSSPGSPNLNSSPEFIGVGECVSVDSFRRRAYIAVGSILNEVDPETLQVVSQEKYPWSIFALSQETDYSAPLTVGTTLSLHIYDSRVSSPGSQADAAVYCEKTPPLSKFNTLKNSPSYPGPSRYRICLPRPPSNADYAPLFQPGPLSILHPPTPNIHTILLAGRFPSILTYDRRFFPRLVDTIHSGARLGGLASFPNPQLSSSSVPGWSESQGVVACGEYNGRGSLELYNLNSNATDSSSTTLSKTGERNRQSASTSKLLSVASHQSRIVYTDAEGNIRWVERDGRSEVRQWNLSIDDLHNKHNLSTHPLPRRRFREQEIRNRFANDCSTAVENRYDSDRGRTSPRLFVSTEEAAYVNGDVVRKILPTGSGLPNDELLIWTGDRIGRLRFVPESIYARTGEGYLDRPLTAKEYEEETEEDRRYRLFELEYSRSMRRALEQQADEVRWMERLGM